MDKDQQTEILDAIGNRSPWENDLRRWYLARHRGPGRVKKPYPGAPDLHFPLCDSLISRTKPFYVQQLYMSENIADFRPLFPQDIELTEQLQSWFNYQLKQHSNFEEEIYSAIDQMLVSGRGIIGVYWDEDKKQLGFCSINPLYFVVPDQVDDLNKDATWVLHIENITTAQYKANKNYNQDDQFVKKISGSETSDASQRSDYENRKAWREGITYAGNNRIIVWNLYTRQSDGILVETLSPSLKPDDDPIREPFTLPYKKGVFEGGAYPFFSIRYEIKDKGWYAPRGIIEQALPFENSLSALWNAKHEYMDFACRPNYETTQPLANIGNIKKAPGDVLPFGLQLAENPPPPMSFSEEMSMTRSVAEYLIQSPDLSSQSHLSGRPGYGGEKPTATQINAVVAQSNQSNDIHGRIFKRDMAQGLGMAWSLLQQYATQNLNYFIGKTSSQIQPIVFNGDYEIELNVSSDSWNKEAQMQKGAALLQLFSTNPNVDPAVITKEALDSFRPGLSRDAFRDSGERQKTEAERQNEEIVMMLNNFSVSVKPFDDDKAHLGALAAFFPVRMQEVQAGQAPPPTPQQAQAFTQHIQGHLQQLGQKRDPAARQAAQQFNQILQVLGSIASQPPQNVVPMAGANGVAQPPPNPMANGLNGGAPDQGQQQNQDKPSAVANALANLIKSGVAVNVNDVNAALINMGLPPLAQSIAPTPQHLNTAKAIAEAAHPPEHNAQNLRTSKAAPHA